jgi:predicted small secreted protein
MSRFRLVLLALFSVAVLSACHTVEGMGKDIQSAGDAIEDAAD